MSKPVSRGRYRYLLTLIDQTAQRAEQLALRALLAPFRAKPYQSWPPEVRRGKRRFDQLTTLLKEG